MCGNCFNATGKNVQLSDSFTCPECGAQFNEAAVAASMALGRVAKESSGEVIGAGAPGHNVAVDFLVSQKADAVLIIVEGGPNDGILCAGPPNLIPKLLASAFRSVAAIQRDGVPWEADNLQKIKLLAPEDGKGRALHYARNCIVCAISSILAMRDGEAINTPAVNNRLRAFKEKILEEIVEELSAIPMRHEGQ